jgi:protein ImuA
VSQSGESANIVLLRGLIARIEGGGSGLSAASGNVSANEDRRKRAPFLERASTTRPGFEGWEERAGAEISGRLPLGGEGFWLDAALGGGVKRGALYEVAPGDPGDQAAACALALGLAVRFACAASGPLVWIVEDFALGETGAPYAPGLLEWGLDPGRLTLVRAADAKTTLWALEEALKCRACAGVVGELWGSARFYGEAPARRLVLAARQGGAPCILLHSAAFGGALSSHGAQARFAVFAAPDQQTAPRSLGAPAVPRRPRFAIQVLKTRFEGGRAVLLDPQERRLLTWIAEKGLFEDPLRVEPAGSGQEIAPPQSQERMKFGSIQGASLSRLRRGG